MVQLRFFLVAVVSAFSTFVHAQEFTAYNAADIHASMDCVFKITTKLYRPNADVSGLKLPKLTVDTEAVLADFQKDATPQMGITPAQVTNIFIPDIDTIYLISTYTTAKTGRTPYDALAHEFVHVLQARVDNVNWKEMTDQDEMDAVNVQTTFRETLAAQVQGGKFVCPN